MTKEARAELEDKMQGTVEGDLWTITVGQWNEELGSRVVNVTVHAPLTGVEVSRLEEDLNNVYAACCDKEYTGHGWGGTDYHEPGCPHIALQEEVND